MTESAHYITPLRGAIIGFGGVALKAHLPAWKGDSRFRIDAVVEPLPERIRLTKRLLPGAAIHRDMESMIAALPVDFVDICVPPCFHEELMLKACRAGLHVLCEKPLIFSADGLTHLREAADAADRVLFVVNNWKYAPLWAKTLEIVKAGKIGAVRKISLSVFRTPGPGGGICDWRRCSAVAGGGILLDHGWHCLYLIMALLNGYPTGISAHMESCEADAGIEETVDLYLRFDAAEVLLHLTRRAACRRNEGIIIGDRDVIRINDDHLLLESGAGIPPPRYDFPEALSAGSHHPAWMKAVMENFHREVRDPRQRGVNFAEAGWCAHLTDLAYRSHRLHGRLMETGPVLTRQFGPRTGRIR